MTTKQGINWENRTVQTMLAIAGIQVTEAQAGMMIELFAVHRKRKSKLDLRDVTTIIAKHDDAIKAEELSIKSKTNSNGKKNSGFVVYDPAKADNQGIDHSAC
jgi:predicted transcriptional regulator